MKIIAGQLSLDFGRGKRFCVYIYRDPRPNERKAIIYIGKGVTKSRPQMHWKFGTNNKAFAAKMAKIKASGLEPIIEYIAFFDNERDAFATEKTLIEKFKNEPSLCNITDRDGQMKYARQLTGDQQRLYTIGKALFGRAWQSNIAKALGVSSRTVRRWVSGEDQPRPGVWQDLAALLRERSQRLRQILDGAALAQRIGC
jgi:hypothetical protein